MTNPTSNFGWQMPTSTDLVTDLPADFEVFGQAVDTSLADLKGGTTGQVLSKASNTNMDFTWVTSDDANAIQNTIVDAKGDLISATGSDVPARLAVGANGTMLVANSAESTGLKWTTATDQFPWTTFTPTYTSFTLGNGTVNYAQYLQIGKIVFVRVMVTLGSTSSVSGGFGITVPVATAEPNSTFNGFANLAGHNGTAQTYDGIFYLSYDSVVSSKIQSPQVSTTQPVTWTTGNSFALFTWYKAA